MSIRLTGQSLAHIGVAFQGFVAIHTQALVGAIGVDASLAAGESGGALVDVHASLAIILQVETGPAFTLIKINRFAGPFVSLTESSSEYLTSTVDDDQSGNLDPSRAKFYSTSGSRTHIKYLRLLVSAFLRPL